MATDKVATNSKRCYHWCYDRRSRCGGVRYCMAIRTKCYGMYGMERLDRMDTTTMLDSILKSIGHTCEEYTDGELDTLEEEIDIVLMGAVKELDLDKYISPCPAGKEADTAMSARLIQLASDCDGIYHVVITNGNNDWSVANFDDAKVAIDFARHVPSPKGYDVKIKYNEIDGFDFDTCTSNSCDTVEF